MIQTYQLTWLRVSTGKITVFYDIFVTFEQLYVRLLYNLNYNKTNQIMGLKFLKSKFVLLYLLISFFIGQYYLWFKIKPESFNLRVCAKSFRVTI